MAQRRPVDAGEIVIGDDGSAVFPAELVRAWGLRPGERVRVSVLSVDGPRSGRPLPGMELAGAIKTRRTATLEDMERP